MTPEKWKQLKKILQTDAYFKKALEPKEGYDIDCIIIKDVVEQHQDKKKKYKPLNNRLFSHILSNAIYHKDVSFKLNRDAETFGDMFSHNYDGYIEDNFKANSCYLNAIVDRFHQAFERRNSDGSRKFKPLTYEMLCSVIGIQYKSQDIGITIHESDKFFEKFKLGLDVLNEFGELLHSYRPPDSKLNPNIKPQVLRILLYNNHCETLDSSAKVKLELLRAKFMAVKCE